MLGSRSTRTVTLKGTCRDGRPPARRAGGLPPDGSPGRIKRRALPDVAQEETFCCAPSIQRNSLTLIYWQKSFPRRSIMRLGYRQTHSAVLPGRLQPGDVMTSIDDVNLDTYCGRVGNLYGRHGLCPPFALRDAAQGWMARDIPLSHCIDVIERYLTGYGRSCPSGSGDRNFAWLNELIQTTWYERSFARQPRPAPKHIRNHDWLDEHGAEELHQRPGRRAALTAGLHNIDSKPDNFEPDSIALRQKAVGAFSPTRQTKPAAEQITPADSGGSRPAGEAQAPSPKKIDVAVAWLRAELAAGEQVAFVVEGKAKSVGIAPRTFDRARHRLGITSRRIGFGRKAKYLMALPAVHEMPITASTEAGTT
jgi:hypothetical protein